MCVGPLLGSPFSLDLYVHSETSAVLAGSCRFIVSKSSTIEVIRTFSYCGKSTQGRT